MDQSSFISFEESNDFVEVTNGIKNNNSIDGLNISNVSVIENKNDDDDNDKRQGLIKLENIKMPNKDKTFKNKLKKNNNITSAQKKDEIMEKYFNNPDNVLLNEVLIEEQQEEEDKQDNTNSIENLTKDFLKEHKKKRLVKYNQQKRARKIHKNAFKQKPKTANINLQEEFKNRWKWKTAIRNYRFRDFDRSDSGLTKF